MKEKFPERIRARQKIYYHKKAGNIVPDLCEICGTDKSLEAHHVDYGQPLLVDWLCSVCHRELHRKEQEQGRSVLQTVQSS